MSGKLKMAFLAAKAAEGEAFRITVAPVEEPSDPMVLNVRVRGDLLDGRVSLDIEFED